MIKTLLFGLSSVLGQQLIETDSTEFVAAVHQRLLDRRDFYLEGGIMMLHEALISIENSELSSYKLQKNITEVPSSYTTKVLEDREEQEEFFALNFKELATALIPEVEEETLRYIQEREGDEMNRDLIEGHLDGAAYVYDRAAYKIYREMTDAAEK